MKNYFLILSLLILCGSYLMSQSRENHGSPAKSVAEKYGINSWSKINSINFTFNVKAENANVKRRWKWEPKSGIVQYSGPDQNGKDTLISYNRNKPDSKDPFLTFVDKRFINDSYWLLFPYHLIWDNNVDIQDQGVKEYPIGHEKGRSLVVQYKNNVGYTPNDVFVLFLDNNNMIKEWIYRPGGSKEKERPYTWEENKKFDGITISTVHYGPGKRTEVWFTDIAVR